MLIDVVEENAENLFLESLWENTARTAGRGVLRCAFSTIGVNMPPEVAMEILKDAIRDNEGMLYLCADGDILVVWRGNLKVIRDKVIHIVRHYYRDKIANIPDDEFFSFYDTLAQGEELGVIIRDKLTRLPKDLEKRAAANVVRKKPTVSKAKPSYSFDDRQTLLRAARERKRRGSNIEILVVEDQDFSRKLLGGILAKWSCHFAKNGEEALKMYAELAPNICFLDIELPDINGHDLAKIFTEYDPDKFIVMVTGNNAVQDVITAKNNKVDGFVVKPYNKQKIFHAVEAHMIKNAM